MKTLRSIFFLLVALPLCAAQQTINTGTNPNDGAGDSLRTAFTKVNANFTDLYNTAVFSNSIIQWSTLTNTPATLAGYGITNGITAATAASTYAPIASPTFTGTVTIPSGASIASPTITGTPTVPTASVDTSTTQAASTAFVLGQAASATPLIDGTAAVGTSTRYARGDHVHPTDTSRAPLASPTFTGTVTIPTGASITSPTINTAANFASTATLNWNSDTYLQRDAANIVAQRNSTTAQGFRIYNTYTDASNYERGVFDWTTTASTLTIGTQAAGTGTGRSINITAANGSVSIGNEVAAANFLRVNAANRYTWANAYFGTSSDGVGDLGQSAANRFNNAYFKNNVVVGNDLQLQKTITAAGTTGAQTINKSSGSVNLAAGATSLVVTDSLVTTSSVILLTVAANDATCKSVSYVPANGSFTIYPNAAPTAETRVNFLITN